MKNKLAIIGGGASGLIAAIAAARNNPSLPVTLFERNTRVGKKILVTGNGRCNLTNTDLTEYHYHGEDVGFVSVALSSFGLEKTLEFFADIGLLTKAEGNEIYPYSLQAGTVLDLLRAECDKRSVEILCDQYITSLKKINNQFIINDIAFDSVIVACGGKASPHLGTDGSSYQLLTDFGHTLTELYPVITQIKTETDYVKQLKGIKIEAVAEIVAANLTRTCIGEVLFTEYGLSGPAILDLSRIAATNTQNSPVIHIDTMPEYSRDEITAILTKKANKQNGTLEELLTGILNKRLGQVLLKYAGFDLKYEISLLSYKEIKKISAAIKQFSFKVTGVKGFQNAPVTAGGIRTKDFNNTTMESKLCPGLYATGEILDIDGDCGGWNLQWAWSSGYLAGKSAAEKLKNGDKND
ncbi:MAG: hypothetical protein BGN88_15160 [Clostridiales bacterium 43-6]|nr:MAG: hypothetical protein BGN88_15160 [Clostridiales bacterium 43-6]